MRSIVDRDGRIADLGDDAEATAERFDVRAKGADLGATDLAVLDLADSHLRHVHQPCQRFLRFALSLANLRQPIRAHFVEHFALELCNARGIGPALCLPFLLYLLPRARHQDLTSL